MRITRFILGELQTNCYLLVDEKTKEAAVIDPADEAETLQKAIENAGVTLKYILLTHGHRDHTLAAPRLHELFPDAAVYIHPADKDAVGNYYYPMAKLIGPALRFYDEGDRLPLGSLTIEVMHTPGHTGGSVCLLCDTVIFTGDTLFAGSMGRIDLPGAISDKMMDSLARLARMEGNYDVLPGHMDVTTLDDERENNPFLRSL